MRNLHIFTSLILLLAILSLFTRFGLNVFSLNGTSFFFGYGDLLFHFALFHIAAWWVCIFPRNIMILGWISLVFLGAFSEVAQATWVPGRDGTVLDATINISSVLFVVLVFSLRKLRA